MSAMARMSFVMSGILVGLGVAITAKTFATVGVEKLVLGHVVGPGMVLAGLARLRLRRMFEDRPPTDEDRDG